MGLRDVAGATDHSRIAAVLELARLGPVADDMGAIVPRQLAGKLFRAAHILRTKPRQSEKLGCGDACFRPHGLHFGLDLSHLFHKLRAPVLDTVSGHDTHIKRQSAVLGGDIVGCAAADRAHVERRVRRIKSRVDVRRRGGCVFGVHLVRPVDQLGGHHNRAYARIGQ